MANSNLMIFRRMKDKTERFAHSACPMASGSEQDKMRQGLGSLCYAGLIAMPLAKGMSPANVLAASE